MAEKAKILKPGYLVSLATNITGGVIYERHDLDERCKRPGKDAMGESSECKLLAGHEGKCNFAAMTAEEITRWQTTRTIADKAEHEAATKLRGKARSMISAVCSNSDFGLLCLASREKELDERYQEARELVAAFNANAKHTHVAVYMMKGLIPDNQMSIEAICSELRQLIDRMSIGINDGDVEEIRKAANEATQLTQMLDEEARVKIAKAIDEARSAARTLVKRVEKGGEKMDEVLKDVSRDELKEARDAFDLDLDVFEKIKKQAERHGGGKAA